MSRLANADPGDEKPQTKQRKQPIMKTEHLEKTADALLEVIADMYDMSDADESELTSIQSRLNTVWSMIVVAKKSLDETK